MFELTKTTFSEDIGACIVDPEWRNSAYFETFKTRDHITDSNFVQNKIFDIAIGSQAIDTFVTMTKTLNDINLSFSIVNEYLKAMQTFNVHSNMLQLLKCNQIENFFIPKIGTQQWLKF